LKSEIYASMCISYSNLIFLSSSFL